MTIHIKEELREGGYWVITSDDLDGLLLCGKSLEILRADIPAAIELLTDLNK